MDTVLSNEDGVLIYTGAPSATDEILAFHYGDFDNAYGDGTVDAAATNGRVYANTDPGDLPEEFGSIGTPSTASGQTTYTWTPPATSLQANVLVVAGGGGGGGSAGGGASGAGGGAGGLIFDTDRAIPSGQQTIVVGDGGTAGGSSNDTPGGNGGNSSAFTLTAVGGGGGGSRVGTDQNNALGRDGGSGGGEGSHGTTLNADAIGEGTAGQGNDGGLNGFSGSTLDNNASGGGGGAGSVGGDGLDNNYSGDGGAGLFVGVFGETYGESGWFAGGGGGGRPGDITNAQGLGGLGGGGDGGNTTGVAGAAHTGGGGGGAGSSGIPARGGSGVVLVRYIVDTTVIVSNYVVNRGLAVLLDAADTASYSGTGTTWTDISGNGRNGTLQGSVSWVDQGSASYFDFSGANADYINQTAGTSQIYKDICIVFQREDDGWNYLLSKSTTADKSLRIIGSNLANPGGAGDWAPTGNPTTYYVNGVADTDAVSVSQNQWYILGGENKNATLLGSAWNYHLGTGYTQDNRNLNGKIAFLALYTEPLTAAEHIHNYNALKHRFGV